MVCERDVANRCGAGSEELPAAEARGSRRTRTCRRASALWPSARRHTTEYQAIRVLVAKAASKLWLNFPRQVLSQEIKDPTEQPSRQGRLREDRVQVGGVLQSVDSEGFVKACVLRRARDGGSGIE